MPIEEGRHEGEVGWAVEILPVEKAEFSDAVTAGTVVDRQSRSRKAAFGSPCISISCSQFWVFRGFRLGVNRVGAYDQGITVLSAHFASLCRAPVLDQQLKRWQSSVPCTDAGGDYETNQLTH